MGKSVIGEFSFGRYLMAAWLPLLVGTALLGFGVATLLTTANQDDATLRFAISIVSAAGGAGLLAWAATQYLGRTSRLEVRPDEVSWVTAGRAGSAAWCDVREVYREDTFLVMPGPVASQQRSEWARRAHVRLLLADGSRVTFRQTLTNYNDLVDAILGYAAEAVFPAKLAETADGREAAFGAVSVGAAGVRVGGLLHPWAEVNYAVSEGWLCVAPAREEFEIKDRREVRLSELPNFLVLLALMARVGKPPADPLLMYPVSWRASMARRL
jgi:hypothetical protein